MILLKIAMIFALAVCSSEGLKKAKNFLRKYKLSEIHEHMKDIEFDSLLAHNTARAWHGVQPLTYDKALEKQALAYAKKCFLKQQYGHDSKELDAFQVGENLYWSANHYTKKSPRICFPAYLWYDEIEKFDWSKLDNSYDFGGVPRTIGHFTQFVWASTKKVGCALVSVKDDRGLRQVIAACRYKPRGNVIFEFPQNVKKPIPNMQPKVVGVPEICPCTDKYAACASRITNTEKDCKHRVFGSIWREDCEKSCKACRKL